LADAVTIYLATITVVNTRETYAAALNRVVTDFGADTDVALLDQEPDRVSGWFTFVWGGKSAKTFNVRLTALASACAYWRAQEWLAGDPLVRLRAKPAPPDTSKALTKQRVADILGSGAPLRERVLWHMLYESSARADEVLMLNVQPLAPDRAVLFLDPLVNTMTSAGRSELDAGSVAPTEVVELHVRVVEVGIQHAVAVARSRHVERAIGDLSLCLLNRTFGKEVDPRLVDFDNGLG
jgi:integrase